MKVELEREILVEARKKMMREMRLRVSVNQNAIVAENVLSKFHLSQGILLNIWIWARNLNIN